MADGDEKKVLDLKDLTPGQLQYVLRKKYESLTDPMEKAAFAANICNMTADGATALSGNPALNQVCKDFVSRYIFNVKDENGNISPELIKEVQKNLLTFQRREMMRKGLRQPEPQRTTLKPRHPQPENEGPDIPQA